MNIFEKLTREDRDLINFYIDEYSYSDYENINTRAGSRASLEKILEPWSKAKENLYKVFGEKFIIEKPITFEMSKEELRKNLDKEIRNIYSPISMFVSRMNVLCRQYGIKYKFVEDYSYFREVGYFFEITSYNLADGKWVCGEAYIEFEGEEKPFKIRKNMRINKIYKKLAEFFHEEELYEKFRIQYSQLTNQKYINGTMCFSIHPLDYMTMSDNESDWHSCMSWQQNGEYRQGTVEMMNSPIVVVAYIRSDNKDMTIYGDSYWNNKKWRELVIIDEEVICSVKGYPYQNDELSSTAIAWAKELVNNDNQYEEEEVSFTESYLTVDDDITFLFKTEYMYSDFGCLPTGYHHKAYLNKKVRSYYPGEKYINYSGDCECVYCGKHGKNVDIEDTGNLICSDCGYVIYCDNCGDRLSSYDDVRELDGNYYCGYCYEEYMAYDDFDPEEIPHHIDNLSCIYLVPHGYDDNRYFWDYAIESRRFFGTLESLKNRDTSLMDKYFVDSINSLKSCYQVAYSHSYYIYAEDLTEEGIKFFGFESLGEIPGQDN